MRSRSRICAKSPGRDRLLSASAAAGLSSSSTQLAPEREYPMCPACRTSAPSLVCKEGCRAGPRSHPSARQGASSIYVMLSSGYSCGSTLRGLEFHPDNRPSPVVPAGAHCAVADAAKLSGGDGLVRCKVHGFRVMYVFDDTSPASCAASTHSARTRCPTAVSARSFASLSRSSRSPAVTETLATSPIWSTKPRGHLDEAKKVSADVGPSDLFEGPLHRVESRPKTSMR